MQKGILYGLTAVCIFVVAAAILLRFMPSPLRSSDYMVIGSVATLVSLLAVFLVVFSSSMKTSDLFFKRRNKKQ